MKTGIYIVITLATLAAILFTTKIVNMTGSIEVRAKEDPSAMFAE